MRKRDPFRGVVSDKDANAILHEMALAKSNDPNLISIDQFAASRGIVDVVRLAAIKGATSRRYATQAQWDEIFKGTGIFS